MESEYYYVEKILSKKENPLSYLVKWEGWSESDATWEPFENLENVMDIVEKFEKESAVKQKSRPKFHRMRCNLNNPSRPTDKKGMRVLEQLEEGEIPVEVLTVKFINGVLHCLIKFEECSDGMQRENAYLPSSVMADLYPGILIDFYESKIRFNA